jgi:hypothetical protein
MSDIIFYKLPLLVGGRLVRKDVRLNVMKNWTRLTKLEKELNTLKE